MAKAKDFFGKNVTEAINEACTGLSVSQDKLNIDVLETGSVGIFGLCRKKAHIRVELKKEVVKKQKRKSPSIEVEDKTSEQKTVVEAVSSDNGGDAIKDDLSSDEGKIDAVGPSHEELESIHSDIDQLLRLMRFPSVVKVNFVNKTVQCDIKTEFQDAIIGQDGRTLDSLQYLVRKMESRYLPERMPLYLDVGDYRQRRKVELRQQALDIAELVKDTGKTKAIPALNPSERRIVHMALQDDKKVRSRSVGEGLFKKVLIYKPGKGRKFYTKKRRGRQGGDFGDSQ